MSQLRNMLQKVVNCQDLHKQTSAVQGFDSPAMLKSLTRCITDPKTSQKFHQYDSADTLVWNDRQRNRQIGFCRVPDDSPLYQLIGEEKIAIRYNPEKPEEFYFPERLKAPPPP